ncbi:MAG: hypothetical protein H0U23_02410 [Blastocatellia bacterium]|nr:hypothetical protein [Blastocatellia bacterium]
MQFARKHSESEDQILIGCILPIVSRILARGVWIEFGGMTFPNLFSMLVTPPGLRKSTTIGLADDFARQPGMLPSNAFLEGASSEQALFKAYQDNPDRLFIEDEGNATITNWANDAQGKLVSKRMLKLYDCRPWSQAYMRQAEKNNNDPLERIEQTSTSLLIGTTFNNCRFNGLETKDGMRRRVNYYLSRRFGRRIDWPTSRAGGYAELVEIFAPLRSLEGQFSELEGDTLEAWREIQRSNRDSIESIVTLDAASEAHSSALSSEPSKIIKFAMLFEACRWARDSSRDWRRIQPDTLQMAAEHAAYCLNASQQLDQIGRLSEIRETADSYLATIRNETRRLEAKIAPDGWIELTKTQLTHRFAANPDRRNAMTATRLYGEILPDLEKRNLAQQKPMNGKLVIYRFMGEDTA